MTSKAFRVLNKKSKKIEENYYVTFDDKFFKNSQQNSNVQSDEIFPSSNSQNCPLMTLYEEFLNLFDDSEKANSSKEKGEDKKEDKLLKLVDATIENIEIHDKIQNHTSEGNVLENFVPCSNEEVVILNSNSNSYLNNDYLCRERI